MVVLLFFLFILYLTCVFKVCLYFAYLSLCVPWVGPCYIGSTLPGHNISLRERKNTSLWEREMVGLLIVFLMLYLCVLSICLYSSGLFNLCHALVHIILVFII